MKKSISYSCAVVLGMSVLGGVERVVAAEKKTPVAAVGQDLGVKDLGWPREFKVKGKKLLVYQPQVDEWQDYASIKFRCAVEVSGVLKEPTFGVAEIDAQTLVDQESRVVKLFTTRREYRFASVSEEEEKALKAAMDELSPPDQMIISSLDRILACLDLKNTKVQKPVSVNLDPPKIYYQDRASIMVMFLGEPQFKPVVAERPDLMFAVNTNWDVFYEPASQSYYLLNHEQWLTSSSPKGPWVEATALPKPLNELPADENWDSIRKQLPLKKGKEGSAIPVVVVSQEPAELLQTRGKPEYEAIPGTKLLEVTNTESVLILDSAGGKFYYLVSGRWFSASRLEGPWVASSAALPEDFGKIPDEHPMAFVKASVPGTEDARDAVLLASVPQNTQVDTSQAPTLKVVYEGDPKFELIPSTTVRYAVNSASSVFCVGQEYYCCDQGVWFTAANPQGPWQWCKSVPSEIYTIPVSSPSHPVTYVTVKESSEPNTVIYQQTAGYSGEYVASTGVLMFGAGLLTAALLDDCHDHYCYPPPCWYSYGCGAVYHYGYGGYYGAAGRIYGPYGGVGHVAAYHPHTGTYARGGYMYGPNGSAGYRTAYNPYTGGYAGRAYRSTPYGSATAGRVYNPYTGARAAAGRVSTAYGSAGYAAGYNPITGRSASARAVSGQRGEAAGIRTGSGAAGVAWDTQRGQGSAIKTRNDNIYASRNGNVYRRDADGNWSSHNGSGWDSVNRPEPREAGQSRASGGMDKAGVTKGGGSKQAVTRPAAQASNRPAVDRSELDRLAQSRTRGNMQTQRVQSYQTQTRELSGLRSGGSSFSGRSSGGSMSGRSGGGRSGGRSGGRR